jgi:choline dehydrogenase
MLIPGDAADDNALAGLVPASLTTYGHPVSTVAMGGPADPGAVVDPAGAVKGVNGLRVVDASIIPEIPSAPTNLTVIMLAERIYQRVYSA